MVILEHAMPNAMTNKHGCFWNIFIDEILAVRYAIYSMTAMGNNGDKTLVPWRGNKYILNENAQFTGLAIMVYEL